jgi:hypothetical protein
MEDEDIKELAHALVNQICNRFGVTGAAAITGGPEPGALEVLSDALTEGNFANQDGLGRRVGEVAHAITELAEAVGGGCKEVADAINNLHKTNISVVAQNGTPGASFD